MCVCEKVTAVFAASYAVLLYVDDVTGEYQQKQCVATVAICYM